MLNNEELDIQLVVIVQCEFASRRCSGQACMQSFYERTGKFENYTSQTRYITFTCGGCCGKGLAVKLEHLTKLNLKKLNLKPEQVALHLASCICKDNYHADICPHLDYLKDLINKKGYKNVVDGTYLSKNATLKRSSGVYKN